MQNGIEGLIHVSELSEKPFAKIEDVLSIGDKVSAKVIKLDPDHKKVSLSIKEFLVHGEMLVTMRKKNLLTETSLFTNNLR